jgi:hypothetical protein
VKVVDVLRDDAVEEAEPLQRDDRPVSGVWLCRADGRVELPADRPVAAARAGRAHEAGKGEIVRVVPRPQACRAPEVRDSRLRRDTGPGEHHNRPRRGDQIGRSVQLGVDHLGGVHPGWERSRGGADPFKNLTQGFETSPYLGPAAMLRAQRASRRSAQFSSPAQTAPGWPAVSSRHYRSHGCLE